MVANKKKVESKDKIKSDKDDEPTLSELLNNKKKLSTNKKLENLQKTSEESKVNTSKTFDNNEVERMKDAVDDIFKTNNSPKRNALQRQRHVKSGTEGSESEKEKSPKRTKDDEEKGRVKGMDITYKNLLFFWKNVGNEIFRILLI